MRRLPTEPGNRGRLTQDAPIFRRHAKNHYPCYDVVVPQLQGIAPFFIVDHLQPSLDFYQTKLGFQVIYTAGGEGTSEDFFGIVARDNAAIMLKAISREIQPQPNHTRHQWARWDAYVTTADPDALYQEYTSRSVHIHSLLADTDDGLRAFEISDNSGYVICFGRPRD